MDFKTIEDAIITELKTSVPYLKAVETYAGQLERDISSLPARFPAAYVTYGGSDFSPGAIGGSGREACAFSVLVCAMSLRGQEHARKETGGAYDAVRDVAAALAHKDFGLDIELMRPVRASLTSASGEMAVYSVNFITAFEHE